MSAPEIESIVIVVPARDEAGTIERCLESIRIAGRRVPASITTDLVVVANGCTDRTAEIARALGAVVVVRSVANVGAARAAGCTWALEHRAGRLDRTWLATTDADSIVPADWLAKQLELAHGGAEVVVGTVALEPDESRRHRAWQVSYDANASSGHRHGHVHGANLGFRSDVYRDIGGFDALATGEDADLVARLDMAGTSMVWAAHLAVTTSARHDARAGGGVGDDLAASVSG